MTKRFSVKQILAEVGSSHLELVDGKGYWYFIFDDGKHFDTLSVYVMRLSHDTFESWVETGRKFVEESKAESTRIYGAAS